MASASRSINKGSDQVFEHNCDVCLTQGITSEGISYCTVCTEYLCQACERSHKGSKASKDHRLLTGSVVPSGSINRKQVPSIMLCDTHKTSILDFICNDHQQVICKVCKITNHSKCRIAALSHQVKTEKSNIDNSFKMTVKDLSDITDKFNHLQNMRQIDKSSIKAQIETYLNDLHKIRKKIDNKLDQLENKMAAEIRDVERKISEEIDGHDAVLKSVLVQIGDIQKSLNECHKSREDEVVFVGINKASLHKTEFEKIINSIQNDLYPIDIRIQTNDILTDLMNQLQTIGTLVTGKQTGYSRSAPTSVTSKAAIDKHVRESRSSPKSLLNIEVTGKREKIDLKSCDARGCVFMADGHLVVACGIDGLKLFDKDCRYISHLDITSRDVAVIDDTSVIVTQGFNKELQRVLVLPNMKVVKTMEMGRKCFGVDVCGDQLYVTCHDDPGYGEVCVLTMDGNVLRRLGVDDGRYMFTGPHYVKVSKNRDKLFVSDYSTNTITCLSTQGRTLYKYTDTDLKSPLGMYVDEADNLFVCGLNSNNIHVIRHDGNREKILLSGKDRIVEPRAISYRPQDGCLAVVSGGSLSQLLTFSTRI